jgi:glycosyltransferase involved in cell wall biosynthesis
MSVPLTRRGRKIFEAEAETDADGMPHVGASPALCLCAFVPIFRSEMDQLPNIDILLATYNGEKYLGEQIESILEQSNRDWQLLIRDDGSEDGTVSIIKDYAAKYSDRIKLVEDNAGRLGTKLNFERLLQCSNSEYVMFCDQDDVWLPKKIEITLNLMKSTEKEHPGKPVLVHTDLRVVDSRLKTIAKSMWRYQRTSPETGADINKVMLQNVATGCTIMINRKAKSISLPIPEEAVMHDWWIVINVAKHGKIAHVPDQLVLYRQHPDNAVGAKKVSRRPYFRIEELFTVRKRIVDHYRMVKKHDPDAAFLPVVLKKIASKVAQICR